MSKPVVLVLGASGRVGMVTLKCLVEKYASKLEIRAGTRDPERAQKIKSLPGVQVVKATIGDEETLSQALVGVDVLFVIPPPLPNAAQLVQSTVQLGKKVGLKHVIVTTGYFDDRSKDMQFDKMGKELVHIIEACGVAYTVILLPLFFETYYQYDTKSITEKGEFPRPHPVGKRYDGIAVSDIGKAAAAISNEPGKYANKVLYIVGEVHSIEEVGQNLTVALGRDVKAREVSAEGYSEYLKGLGTIPFVAAMLTQYFQFLGSDTKYGAEGDKGMLRSIIGEEPEGLKTWVEKNAKNFQQ